MALSKRGMSFRLEAVPLSLQFTPVKAICNVAAVRAIFPGAVLVDAKFTSAMTAGDLTITVMFDQFRVRIPPFCPASIRAKKSGFPTRNLNHGCAAAFTRFSYGVSV